MRAKASEIQKTGVDGGWTGWKKLNSRK